MQSKPKNHDTWLQQLTLKLEGHTYQGHPDLIAVIKPDKRPFEWPEPTTERKPLREVFRGGEKGASTKTDSI